MTIFSASDQNLRVCLLVLPESSMMSLASTLDTMRAANRIESRTLFEWQIVTLDGDPATLTCGIPVAAKSKLAEAQAGEVIFVIAGFNQDKHVNKEQLKLIK